MFGPLFVKELLEMARRRRYFLVRVLIGAALLLGWWIGLSGQSWRIDYRSIGNLSAIGESMFRWWAYLSLWGVVILTPLLVGGLIAAEKDGRTFETLLTTLLTNREILIGKAASRLLLLSILIASSVPILAVASLYGGFDVKQVLTAVAVIGSTCLFVVVIALYYSTITYKPYVAMLRTYFFLAVLWWLLPAATAMLDTWKVRSPWQMMSIANGDETYYAGRAMQWRFRGVSYLQYAPKTGMLASIIQENTLYLVLAGSFHLAIAVVLYWRSNLLLRKRLQPGKPPWIFTAALRLYQAMVSGSTELGGIAEACGRMVAALVCRGNQRALVATGTGAHDRSESLALSQSRCECVRPGTFRGRDSVAGRTWSGRRVPRARLARTNGRFDRPSTGANRPLGAGRRDDPLSDLLGDSRRRRVRSRTPIWIVGSVDARRSSADPAPDGLAGRRPGNASAPAVHFAGAGDHRGLRLQRLPPGIRLVARGRRAVVVGRRLFAVHVALPSTNRHRPAGDIDRTDGTADLSGRHRRPRPRVLRPQPMGRRRARRCSRVDVLAGAAWFRFMVRLSCRVHVVPSRLHVDVPGGRHR